MAEPLTKNAADREAQRWARRKEKQRAMQSQAALHAMLEDPTGRRVLWDLLELAGVYKSVFAAGAPDLTAWQAGRQDYGHELIVLMFNANDRGYATMQAEAVERRRREDAEIAAQHTAGADTNQESPDGNRSSDE
jgi:hypothetical protein